MSLGLPWVTSTFSKQLKIQARTSLFRKNKSVQVLDVVAASDDTSFKILEILDSRNFGQPLRDVPGEECDYHLVPDQHGALWQIDGLISVLLAACKLSWNSSHSVECRQLGTRKKGEQIQEMLGIFANLFPRKLKAVPIRHKLFYFCKK